MHKGDRAKFRRAWQEMEPLESRRMLSAGVIDVIQGLPDLQVSLAPTYKTPVSLLSGNGKEIKLPVDITNIAFESENGKTVAVPAALEDAKQLATIKVFAHRVNAEAGEEDIKIGEMVDVPLAGLKVGAKKSIKVPVLVNDDVGGGGDWTFVVKLDTEDTVRELGETDGDTALQANNIFETAPFLITMGRPDLQVVINDKVLPVETISGIAKTYRVPFKVTNTGTLAVAKDITTTVRITLQSESREDSLELDPISVAVGGLRPGGSVSGFAVVNFSNEVSGGADLFVDPQSLLFLVDPDDGIKELNEENNSAKSKTVQVTFGESVLSFETLARSGLPTKPVRSGSDSVYTISLKMTNAGNVPWSSELVQHETNIVLTPHGAAAEDWSYKTENSVPIEKPDLAAGKSRTFRTTISMHKYIQEGTYDVYLQDVYTDPDGVEQTRYFLASNTPLIVQQDARLIDFEVAIAPNYKPPKVVLSGDGKTYKLPVQIRNTGTVTSAKNLFARIKFIVVQDSSIYSVNIQGEEFEGTDINVGNIAPGKTKTTSISVTFVAGVGQEPPASEVYSLVAQLLAMDVIIDEWFVARQSARSPEFRLIRGLPDLAITTTNVHLPDTLISGSGKTFNIPATIKNVGNLKTADDDKVNVKVFANDGQGHLTEVAKLEAVEIPKLAPNGTVRVTVPVTLTSELPSGDYTFQVVVDPDNGVDEHEEVTNNIAIVGESIVVTQGLPDLTGTIDGSALAGITQHAGDGTLVTFPLTISNIGTLATAKDQLVNVRLFVMPTAGGTEIPVKQFENLNISALKVNGVKKFTLKAALPITMQDGDYQIRAEIDPATDILEVGDTVDTNAENNTIFGPTITAQRIGPDLSLAFAENFSLPSTLVSGDGVKFALPMTITNVGGAAVPRNSQVNIIITAHNQGDGEDRSKDVAVTEFTGVRVGGLAPGASMTFEKEMTLPAGIGTGQFVLTAQIDESETLPELEELINNTANTGPLTAVQPLP